MENENNNYAFEIKVHCQFPMLHFQEMCGYKVGLRASDIKPRLDRYLRGLIGDSNLKQYFKKDTKALDYKLFIDSFNHDNGFELNTLNNKGRKIKKSEVFYYGDYSKLYSFDCNLKFICFYEGLKKIIKDNISNFFLLNNFGTMQSKGYGSFTIEKYDNLLNEKEIKKIGKIIKDFTGNSVYYFELKRDKNKYKFYSKVSTVIKNYYNVLKHGKNYSGDFIRSYIYEYAHEKEMNNEKAMMKVFNISPNISKNEKNKIKTNNKNDKFYYVRAVLGLTNRINYKISVDKFDTKAITIQSKNNDIERIPSPIKFKIIGNIVFVFNYNVPDFILNKEFKFINENESKTISTPKQFDVAELLSKYNQKYNGSFLKILYGENIEEYKIKEVNLNE